MDLLAKEIETSGVMRPMKGNYLAFVLRSGRAKKKKRGRWDKTFVWGMH